MTTRLGERLLRAKLLQAEDIQRALDHQKLTGHRFGDCLVEMGLLPETTMLRFLAEQLGTLFVSTEKLAKAMVLKKAVERVPVRFAEEYGLVPVAVDENLKVLTVVCAEPQNHDALQELALLTDMREVVAYVALRSAVRSAIRKLYYDDSNAFDEEMAETEAVRGDLSAIVKAYEESSQHASPQTVFSELTPLEQVDAPSPKAPPSEPSSNVKEHDLAEMLNVLVGMLELPQNERRGHSAQLSRMATSLGQELGLSPQELASVAVAAQLHDLGKPRNHHLTLYSVFQQESWQEEARLHLEAPLRLFENVRLPRSVSDILTQLYEAWNGSGLPLGLRRTEIRMGARILALLDSFLDLTQNPNNCIGRKLSSQSALNMLKAQSGSLFDPDVVRLLEMSRKGEGLRRRLRSNGRQILLALSNETLRNEVSEALLAREWPTHAVSKLDGVAEAVLHREADALVLDASFSIGELASLFKQVRGAPECAGIPIFVLGIPRELDVKERLESAQVTLLALPQTAEALAKSIDAAMVDFVALGAAGRVVNGSFDELPLAELLRALDEQQKSGRLVIQTTVEEGSVFLEEGRAIWARFHQHRGLEALHNLTESTPRAFSFDPEALSFDLPHMNVSFSEWLSTHPST